jgi:transposase
MEAALARRPPANTRPRKLDGEREAHLIALACSEPPDGRERWSIRLLARRFVELECGVEVSRELVRRTLKKAG